MLYSIFLNGKKFWWRKNVCFSDYKLYNKYNPNIQSISIYQKKEIITDEVGLESHQQYHVLDQLNLLKL